MSNTIEELKEDIKKSEQLIIDELNNLISKYSPKDITTDLTLDYVGHTDGNYTIIVHDFNLKVEL